MAQASLVEGLPVCQPFDSLMRPTPLVAWHCIAGDEGDWGPLTCDLSTDFFTGTLPSVKSSVSLSVRDRAGATFMTAFDSNPKEGRRGKARMLGLANGPALAWATAVPGASTIRLNNEQFIVDRRHTLGLDMPR